MKKTLAFLASLPLLIGLGAGTSIAKPIDGKWNHQVGTYVEGNIGTSLFSVEPLDDSDASIDIRGSFALNANVGYQFYPYFGVEAGYSYFSFGRDRNDGSSDFGDGLHAIHLALKGILPVANKLDLFAKLGAGGYGNEFHNQFSGGYGLYLAAGAGYYFTPKLSVNLQAENTTYFGFMNLQSTMIGLKYDF